jgi:hypothetical protein
MFALPGTKGQGYFWREQHHLQGVFLTKQSAGPFIRTAVPLTAPVELLFELSSNHGHLSSLTHRHVVRCISNVFEAGKNVSRPMSTPKSRKRSGGNRQHIAESRRSPVLNPSQSPRGFSKVALCHDCMTLPTRGLAKGAPRSKDAQGSRDDASTAATGRSAPPAGRPRIAARGGAKYANQDRLFGELGDALVGLVVFASRRGLGDHRLLSDRQQSTPLRPR